ncbi:hypothetical protein [Rhodovulum sp. PH10]|uniref:hypothetical protein n=1 Tax=Rhodovulum sp. PH10 TaxID=1187851 RepID=UPI00058CCCD7|nr:hypothetical protein [Rhodovulum sp. PH10]
MPRRHKETENAGWGWNASQTAYRVEYHGRSEAERLGNEPPVGRLVAGFRLSDAALASVLERLSSVFRQRLLPLEDGSLFFPSASELRVEASDDAPFGVANDDAHGAAGHDLGATGVPAVDRAAGLALGIADGEGAAGQPQDGDLAQIFDWATRTMDRTAGMAEEAVADRRRLIREMAARKRLIDHRLAKTSRALERLMAG